MSDKDIIAKLTAFLDKYLEKHGIFYTGNLYPVLDSSNIVTTNKKNYYREIPKTKWWSEHFDRSKHACIKVLSNSSNNNNNNNNDNNNNNENNSNNKNAISPIARGLSFELQGKAKEIEVPKTVRELGQLVALPKILPPANPVKRNKIIFHSKKHSKSTFFMLIYNQYQTNFSWNDSDIVQFWDQGDRKMFPIRGPVVLLKIERQKDSTYMVIDYTTASYAQDFKSGLFSTLTYELRELQNFTYNRAKAVFQKPQKFLLVDDAKTLASAIKLLENVEEIAVDTEGSGSVKLIQMAFKKNNELNVIIFDVWVYSKILEGIKPTLESSEILKIFHDARSDHGLLLKEKIQLDYVFDTRIATQHITKKNSDIGFNELLKKYKLPTNILKEVISAQFMEKDCWQKRPIKQEKLDYATMDVTLLLKVYHTILEKDIDSSSDYEKNIIIKRFTDAVRSRTTKKGFIPAPSKVTEKLDELNSDMKRKVTLNFIQFDNSEVEKLLNLNPPIFPTHITEKISDQLKEQPRVISEIIFSKGRPCFLRFSDRSGGADDCLIEISNPIIQDQSTTDGSSDNIIDDDDDGYGFDNDELQEVDEENTEDNQQLTATNRPNDIIDSLLSLLLARGKPKPTTEDGNANAENTNVNGQAIRHLFRRQHRTGINTTFHRISAIFNDNHVTGLTYRIGRMSMSKVNIFEQLVGNQSNANSRKSILLIGPPGSGKTTILRSLIRELSDIYMRHIIIVDKTAEICGPSKIVPRILGSRTRKMIPDSQHPQSICESLVEAVSNHNPDYVAIDELANKNEVNAIAAIAERGISLIASVHGKGIESLVKNAELNRLLGGSQAVILSAAEAEERRAKGVKDNDRKTAVTRVFESLFDIVVELHGDHCYVIDNPQSYFDGYLELQ